MDLFNTPCFIYSKTDNAAETDEGEIVFEAQLVSSVVITMIPILWLQAKNNK